MHISSRPAKQFLYNNLREIFKDTEGREVGLDIACGKMNFRPQFHTKRYIGVDLDEERIKYGIKRFPDNTEGRVCKIEDMEVDLQGDFVACIQAIGTNHRFNTENTMTCVNKLVAATREGGVLVFNTGEECIGCDHDIKALLSQSFEDVRTIYYGAFNIKTFRPISFILAYFMEFLPFLRTIGKKKRILYICRNRTANALSAR